MILGIKSAGPVSIITIRWYQIKISFKYSEQKKPSDIVVEMQDCMDNAI